MTEAQGVEILSRLSSLEWVATLCAMILAWIAGGQSWRLLLLSKNQRRFWSVLVVVLLGGVSGGELHAQLGCGGTTITCNCDQGINQWFTVTIPSGNPPGCPNLAIAGDVEINLGTGGSCSGTNGIWAQGEGCDGWGTIDVYMSKANGVPLGPWQVTISRGPTFATRYDGPRPGCSATTFTKSYDTEPDIYTGPGTITVTPLYGKPLACVTDYCRVDFDGDGFCDPQDTDDDNDGCPDSCDPQDNNALVGCPINDCDCDGVFNADEWDDDGDGTPDTCDPNTCDPNVGLACDDNDGDCICDATDNDDDNDEIPDDDDPEPNDPGAPGPDPDGDGLPNGDDTDDDGDGVSDNQDDDPYDPDLPGQDTDGDGIGNGQDPDDDNDDIPDGDDPGPGDPQNPGNDPDGDGVSNPVDNDDDGDGIPDGQDNEPYDPCAPNAFSPGCDNDGDGLPNGGDGDNDGDGYPDGSDPEPNNPDVPGSDPDGDGVPSDSDPDDDGDGEPDGQDNSPSGPGSGGPAGDTDDDGQPNSDDSDDDGDGCSDDHDSHPHDPQQGCGQEGYPDTDGDGCDDTKDAYPNDPKYGCGREPGEGETPEGPEENEPSINLDLEIPSMGGPVGSVGSEWATTVIPIPLPQGYTYDIALSSNPLAAPIAASGTELNYLRQLVRGLISIWLVYVWISKIGQTIRQY